MFFKKFLLIILLAIYIIVFKNLINFSLISSGDFLKIEEVNLIPYIWDWNPAFGGLGGVTLGFSWLHFVITLPTFFLKPLGFSWVLIQKLAYIYPVLILLILSPIVFFKKLFPKNNFYFLSSLVYALNTYILMLIGGGQIYIALAYSLAPIVLYSLIDLMQGNESKYLKNLKYSVFAGLLFTLQSMIDLRIAYVTLFALGIYFLFNIKQLIFGKNLKEIVINNFYIFIIPLAVSALLHAFWILPLVAGGKNSLTEFGGAYSSLESVKFFSFAKLEDSISLLHPNWPENIFGKTGFLKQEFLFFPILAFLSLLFINKKGKEKIYVIFFALLALLGAFLAKGANEPFGGVYLWLFDNFPGFNMFRDPTKWYTLVAISYSILIPFSIWKIYEYLSTKYKKIKYIPQAFLVLVIAFLLFLIRPALLGQLSGTFKTTQIPQDYVKFEKFLSSQQSFSRTLWVPTIQRFGYYSNSHPAIPAQNLFKTVDYSQILKNLRMSEAQKLLQEAGVKFVIVPYDSQGEIFIKDREYSDKIYIDTVKNVSSVKWLKKVEGFGKIEVFEVSNPKDYFWTTSETLNLNYKYISPVEYRLEVTNARKGDVIVFSESYDARWIARSSDTKFYDWPNLISSNPYSRIFNSFVLRKEGNYTLKIYYYPQILVNIGMIISGASLLITLSAIFYLKKRKI